jgi:hypothetical protein
VREKESELRVRIGGAAALVGAGDIVGNGASRGLSTADGDAGFGEAGLGSLATGFFLARIRKSSRAASGSSDTSDSLVVGNELEVGLRIDFGWITEAGTGFGAAGEMEMAIGWIAATVAGAVGDPREMDLGWIAETVG